MNDFKDIEKELRKLRPVQPSAGLIEKVARELESAPSPTEAEDKIIRPVSFRFGGFSLGAALAAAAAIFILARVDISPVTPQKSRVTSAKASPAAAAAGSMQFLPEGAERVVYHTRDEGLVFPGDSATPVRKVRSRTRETLNWRNPRTNESIRVTYPSEVVRLIPVSGQ